MCCNFRYSCCFFTTASGGLLGRGPGSPSMSTMTSTSDSLPSSIPEADRKTYVFVLLSAASIFFESHLRCTCKMKMILIKCRYRGNVSVLKNERFLLRRLIF